MFEQLSGRLEKMMRFLRGEVMVTEKNMAEALKMMRLALLEADVNYKVVKDFEARIREKALGEDVLRGLNPAHQVIKIVHDELAAILGGVQKPLQFSSSPPSIFMLVGLQGSGKTTTCGKLGRYLREKEGRHPLLVAADIHRPAAIDQLQIIGDQLSLPVWREDGKQAPEIAVNGVAHARDRELDTVIIDTAGRLHIDEEMMREVTTLARRTSPHEIFLVCDAMTGQDAVRSARAFNEQLELTGVILTKLDGDARGGAAISVKAVTGKPIRFVGVGEHLDRLEPFFPERMASRILGMGDVVSLVEKAREQVSVEEQERLLERMVQDRFDLNDFLGQLEKVEKMGSLRELLSYIPGFSHQLDNLPTSDEELKGAKAIIQSMTARERANPEILNTSRRMRLARGSGRPLAEVNDLLTQFKQLRKMVGELSQAGGKGPFGKLKSLANLKRMMRPEKLTELMHGMMGQERGRVEKPAAQKEIDREELKRKRKLERQRKKKARKGR